MPRIRWLRLSSLVFCPSVIACMRASRQCHPNIPPPLQGTTIPSEKPRKKFQHAAWGFLAIAGFFDSLGCNPARGDGKNECFYLQTVCKEKDADATSWTIVPTYRIEVLAVFFQIFFIFYIFVKKTMPSVGLNFSLLHLLLSYL